MNVIQEINNVNDKFATQGSKLKIDHIMTFLMLIFNLHKF